MVEKHQRVLNCNGYTTFWITWTDNVLKIGLGAIVGSAELMHYSDSNMPAINVMSVATGWGATGQWGIVDCPGIEGSIMKLLLIGTELFIAGLFCLIFLSLILRWSQYP